jgi:hypothetical protein
MNDTADASRAQPGALVGITQATKGTGVSQGIVGIVVSAIRGVAVDPAGGGPRQ